MLIKLFFDTVDYEILQYALPNDSVIVDGGYGCIEIESTELPWIEVSVPEELPTNNGN